MKTETDVGLMIGSAIRECLISPNEADANLEPANVVDGLCEIARAMNRIAKALTELRESGLHVSVNNPDFEAFTVALKREEAP